MRNVCVLLSLQMLMFLPLSGQQRYSFTTVTQTYQNLDNPTILNDSSYPESFDDFMVESDFLIPYFDGRVYSILVTNRGRIYFGSQVEYAELLPVSLKMKNDSQISYQKVGASNCGSRILKIEYKNMGFRCDTTNTHFTNVQFWIYENSGLVEIHFGESFDNPAIYRTSETNCYGQNVYGCRLRFSSDWSAQPYGDADDPNYFEGGLSNQYYGVARIPSNGIIYQFDPELLSDNDFRISPNPARFFTKISRPLDCGDFEIRIFNVQGQLVFRNVFIENEKNIDVSNLLIGVYFIQVFDKKNKKSFVEKLLIL
ncbi:MAG: T9SS type A sorting domain-containing protein [Saprospiraceae bacterium]